MMTQQHWFLLACFSAVLVGLIVRIWVLGRRLTQLKGVLDSAPRDGGGPEVGSPESSSLPPPLTEPGPDGPVPAAGLSAQAPGPAKKSKRSNSVLGVRVQWDDPGGQGTPEPPRGPTPVPELFGTPDVAVPPTDPSSDPNEVSMLDRAGVDATAPASQTSGTDGELLKKLLSFDSSGGSEEPTAPQSIEPPSAKIPQSPPSPFDGLEATPAEQASAAVEAPPAVAAPEAPNPLFGKLGEFTNEELGKPESAKPKAPIQPLFAPSFNLSAPAKPPAPLPERELESTAGPSPLGRLGLDPASRKASSILGGVLPSRSEARDGAAEPVPAPPNAAPAPSVGSLAALSRFGAAGQAPIPAGLPTPPPAGPGVLAKLSQIGSKPAPGGISPAPPPDSGSPLAALSGFGKAPASPVASPAAPSAGGSANPLAALASFGGGDKGVPPAAPPVRDLGALEIAFVDNPEDLNCLRELSEAYLQAGQYDNAKEGFEELLDSSEASDGDRFNLGLAHLKSGLPDKARPLFEEVSKAKGSAWASKALGQLLKLKLPGKSGGKPVPKKPLKLSFGKPKE